MVKVGKHTLAMTIFNRWIPIPSQHLDWAVVMDAAGEDVRCDAGTTASPRGLGWIIPGNMLEGEHVPVPCYFYFFSFFF